MAYNKSQRNIQRAIVEEGRAYRLPKNLRRLRRKMILSALATGAVESNFSEPGELDSDLDSAGWRQERRSSYPGKNRMNERAAARRYFAEWVADAPKDSNIGAQAQAVQQSAFPERYQQRADEARDILASFKGVRGKAAGRRARAGGGGVRASGSIETKAPTLSHKAGVGVSDTTALVDILAQSLQAREPVQSAGIQAPQFAAGPAFPGGYTPVAFNSPAVVDTSLDDALQAMGTLVAGGLPQSSVEPGSVRTLVGAAKAKNRPRVSGKGGKGRKRARGQDLPPGGQIIEVFHDPLGKYYDNGQVVSGAIGGHGGHVHVSADPRTALVLGREAQKRGLHVGENPFFDPVDPVHTGGSYHYKSKRIRKRGGGLSRRKVGFAIDVSGGTPEQRAEFARDVMSLAAGGGGKRGRRRRR